MEGTHKQPGNGHRDKEVAVAEIRRILRGSFKRTIGPEAYEFLRQFVRAYTDADPAERRLIETVNHRIFLEVAR